MVNWVHIEPLKNNMMLQKKIPYLLVEPFWGAQHLSYLCIIIKFIHICILNTIAVFFVSHACITISGIEFQTGNSSFYELLRISILLNSIFHTGLEHGTSGWRNDFATLSPAGKLKYSIFDLSYSSLWNNSEANLIFFLKKSSLQNFIPSCRFIYFWKKFLAAKLFHPADLLNLEKFSILQNYSILHNY